MKMRFLSLTALILGTQLSLGCSGKPAFVGDPVTPQGPTNFTRAEQKFSVYLPTVPTEHKDVGKFEFGDLETTAYESVTSQPAMSYVVSVIKMLPEHNLSDDPMTLFEDTQAEHMKTSGGVVENKRLLTLNGMAGCDFTITAPNGLSTRNVLYITPEYYYQIYAEGQKQVFDSRKPEIDTVVNSFRLN